jgi:ABC-type multidrug transport system fused ATPase/permease subunit
MDIQFNLFSIEGLSIVSVGLTMFKLLFPWFRRIWLKPTTAIKGYLRGKKVQKTFYYNYQNHIRENQTNIKIENLYMHAQEATKFFEEINKLSEKTLDKFTSGKKEIIQVLDSKVKDLEGKIKDNNKEINDTKNNVWKESWGDFSSKAKSNFTSVLGEKLMYLGIAFLILFVDSIISGNIIKELGIPGYNIYFLIDDGMSYLLGLFITICVAIFFHAFLGNADNIFETIPSFGKKIFAGFILVLLIMLFALTIDNRMFFEWLLRFSWALGIIGVYWLIGRLVKGTNNEDDFKNLFKALLLLTGLIFVIWIVSGIITIIIVIIIYIWKGLVGLFLTVQRMYYRKSLQNEKLIKDVYEEYYMAGVS